MTFHCANRDPEAAAISLATKPAAANRRTSAWRLVSGLTGSFYSSNRVIDDDPFYVNVVLINGQVSW